MAQGPWGGPRITEALPFSSDEVEVTFEENRISRPPIPKELQELMNGLGEDIGMAQQIDRTVIVKQKPDKGPIDILNRIQQEVADLGERAAGINYYIINEDIGYIQSTFVDKRFRRRGIASEMREEAIDDMSQLGVEEIYMFPASDAGEELARSQGFTESEVEPFLSKKV